MSQLSDPFAASGPTPPVKHRRRPSRKLVAGLVLVVLAVVFVFQNTGRGRISFLFWHLTMPAWIWLLSIFVVGVVVGSVFPWLRRSKRRAAKGDSD
jgi:uncharacterized integral membrane protein